jgi:hypothetical protein
MIALFYLSIALAVIAANLKFIDPKKMLNNQVRCSQNMVCLHNAILCVYLDLHFFTCVLYYTMCVTLCSENDFSFSIIS